MILFDVKSGADIVGNLGRGGGGEADDAFGVDLFGESGDLEVVWPEGMAPLGYSQFPCHAGLKIQKHTSETQ